MGRERGIVLKCRKWVILKEVTESEKTEKKKIHIIHVFVVFISCLHFHVSCLHVEI